MRDGWGEQNNKYKRNNSDQSQRNGCNNRQDTQTTATEPQHTGQISTVCVHRHYCCWRLSPFFCVFYPLLFFRISQQRRKATSVQPKPCFFVLSVFFIFFSVSFFCFNSRSSFNLPGRTVTIHHVCLNIVELPALLSPSAGIHNQSHMSWKKNTFFSLHIKRKTNREKRKKTNWQEQEMPMKDEGVILSITDRTRRHLH